MGFDTKWPFKVPNQFEHAKTNSHEIKELLPTISKLNQTVSRGRWWTTNDVTFRFVLWTHALHGNSKGKFIRKWMKGAEKVEGKNNTERWSQKTTKHIFQMSKLLIRILYKGQNHNVPTVSMVEFIFRIHTCISQENTSPLHPLQSKNKMVIFP